MKKSYKKIDLIWLNHVDIVFSQFNSRLKLQRRWGSSTHTNSAGSIMAAKNETIPLNKESSTRVSSQIKTVISLFAELVKTSTPSFDFSLSNLTKRAPFQNLQTDKSKDNDLHTNKNLEQKDGSESRTGIPLYFDILGRKQGGKTVGAIPQWKIKRKTVSQESIDARTKHVVSAVAKAVTKSSLLVRLEDFCRHMFEYPQAKSLASRVRSLNLIIFWSIFIIHLILFCFVSPRRARFQFCYA